MQHQHLPKVHAFYSTPSCYLRSLLETNEAWSELDEDLFPYTDGVPGSGPEDAPPAAGLLDGILQHRARLQAHREEGQRSPAGLQAARRLGIRPQQGHPGLP
ncbi:hypothetical protein V5799_012345 [Amblyomma americanum]|uniref:Uncharacterized protein n=1 Tax=Amblyomma americanum TaxID=6943 RepID=A0AAQ4EEK2_AMBAM